MNYQRKTIVKALNALDYHTAKKIQALHFPDPDTFQKAQKIGASTYDHYQFVLQLEAPDYQTALKIQ